MVIVPVVSVNNLLESWKIDSQLMIAADRKQGEPPINADNSMMVEYQAATGQQQDAPVSRPLSAWSVETAKNRIAQ